MRSTWLVRGQHRECLLFFAGWGMDVTPFADLPIAECDLCLVYDYRDLEPLDWSDLLGYDRLHLVAWSFGVWAASQVLADRASSLTSATAIGGTLLPLEDQRGIPVAIFEQMLATLDPQSLAAFHRDMFDDQAHLARFQAHQPQRPLEELRREMARFREAFLGCGPGPDLYTRAIVTGRDRIFSGRNQLRAWGRERSISTSWPHFPFYHLADWRDLLPRD